MNKRINDLKGKALDQAVPYTWHHLNQVQMDDVLNKFAELIVRECVKAADEWYQYHNEIQWDPGEHIKQHFGVEE